MKNPCKASGYKDVQLRNYRSCNERPCLRKHMFFLYNFTKECDENDIITPQIGQELPSEVTEPIL